MRGSRTSPKTGTGAGCILEYTVADNLMLGLQQRFAERGVLDARSRHENAPSEISRLRHPARRIRALPARALSGGNQQKIVVAREMGRDFTVLLASQPTRGVDVGAIEFIHAAAAARRATRGKAILLVSRRAQRGAGAGGPHRRDVRAASSSVVMPARRGERRGARRVHDRREEGNAA